MLKEQLITLLRRYQPKGVVKGGELCLDPPDALHLAEELEALNVALLGIDGWYYIDRKQGLIAQDLSVDLDLSHLVLHGPNPVHESVASAKAFLQTKLPERTAYVSFTLHVPVDWDLFPE